MRPPPPPPHVVYSPRSYVVAGSSGKSSAMQAIKHPAMAVSSREFGSLVLDVEAGSSPAITASFLTSKGTVLDTFRIAKAPSETVPEPPACA